MKVYVLTCFHGLNLNGIYVFAGSNAEEEAERHFESYTGISYEEYQNRRLADEDNQDILSEDVEGTEIYLVDVLFETLDKLPDDREKWRIQESMPMEDAPIIHKMLDISMGHLSQPTRSALDELDLINHFTGIVVYEKEDYGYFVVVTEDAEETPFTDLNEVIAYAKANNCEWIMLDVDGCIQEGLTYYE